MVQLYGTICQILGILHLVMAYGRPIKQVKFKKPQKAHLHPLRDVRVKKLKKSMHRLPSSAPETKCGHPDAGRTAGRTDGHRRRRQYPPPPLRQGGDKNSHYYSYIFMHRLRDQLSGFTNGTSCSWIH